ncbi:MAG: glycosyltransferase [Hamadaea sp.]|nr:glycosyltransferase [Hamadaea sp.]
MRILLWHVHGSWTTAFVQGKHTYLMPVLPGRGPDGRGRARTYSWPDSVVEVRPEDLPSAEIDCVVLQRPHESDLLARWMPGMRRPVVYVEHNTPRGDVPDNRHPVADRDDLTLVHVTHFNDLFWDAGGTRSAVIEHGVPDPGPLYRGDLDRFAVAINEPVRRWRVTGTDLLPRFAAVAPLDVYGIGAADLPAALPPETRDRVAVHDDPPQTTLHDAMALRRAYVHPMRWTSLGLSLIEAMTLGMPVLALATTEAIEAVPASAGVLSTRMETLLEAAHWLRDDPAAATAMGRQARTAALRRYNLDRFLADWDRLLLEVCTA